MQDAYKAIGRVADQTFPVLITGESGTGKELVARAVYQHSPRAKAPFLALSCAAIPENLLESELFGHEKGAYTGAVARKLGRFEIANRGTLFLDEIGDIPLELQAKLLRVLQEQEFERLGSNQTQKVNVRIVAATHRNLKRMVQEKQFRSDLFFRLSVFPISVPPLRDRREDIPILVRNFVYNYAHRMGRQIETIPQDTMSTLTEYDWPGNVRELQNFIERAVILSPGLVLRAPLESLDWSGKPNLSESKTLAQTEFEHILRVVKESDWVIGGPMGAATKLGLKRTTLIGKMRKLGLSRSSEAISSLPARALP
jgi:transcriptional regulator with GAF, ATPase, and Fis domain